MVEVVLDDGGSVVRDHDDAFGSLVVLQGSAGVGSVP